MYIHFKAINQIKKNLIYIDFTFLTFKVYLELIVHLVVNDIEYKRYGNG